MNTRTGKNRGQKTGVRSQLTLILEGTSFYHRLSIDENTRHNLLTRAHDADISIFLEG